MRYFAGKNTMDPQVGPVGSYLGIALDPKSACSDLIVTMNGETRHLAVDAPIMFENRTSGTPRFEVLTPSIEMYVDEVGTVQSSAPFAVRLLECRDDVASVMRCRSPYQTPFSFCTGLDADEPLIIIPTAGRRHTSIFVEGDLDAVPIRADLLYPAGVKFHECFRDSIHRSLMAISFVSIISAINDQLAGGTTRNDILSVFPYDPPIGASAAGDRNVIHIGGTDNEECFDAIVMCSASDGGAEFEGRLCATTYGELGR